MASRNYRCPHCKSVQSANPAPDRKVTVTCGQCGGRFKIPPLAARQRQRTSTAHANVKEQLARQAEAMRSEDQRAKLDRIVAERRLGDYDILDELGRGGMGVVFKAFHRNLKRMVALKVVLPDLDDQATLLKRFKREAELHARLSHPNIVHVYDYGIIDGIHYFAMDFVTGTQLTKLIGSPEFKLEKRVRVLQQVADALEHAHKHGVVHRDIKPDNVIVDAGWQAHLVDFGIAKPTDKEGHENITRQGLAVGTPHYMAPEQFRPKLGEVGPLSDVYALGAVGYHTLAGQPPFEADTAHAVLIKAATKDPEPLTEMSTISDEALDADLNAIIHRAMKKMPGERYISGKALAADLERWLAGDEVEARPLSSRDRLKRKLAGHRDRLSGVAAASGVALGLTIAVVVALFMMRSSVLTGAERLGAVQTDEAAVQTTLTEVQTALTSSAGSITGIALGTLGLVLIVLLVWGYGFAIRPILKAPKPVAATETLPDEISTTADEV